MLKDKLDALVGLLKSEGCDFVLVVADVHGTSSHHSLRDFAAPAKDRLRKILAEDKDREPLDSVATALERLANSLDTANAINGKIADAIAANQAPTAPTPVAPKDPIGFKGS